MRQQPDPARGRVGNYASTHRVLPPGVVNDTGPILDQPKGYHFGWMVRILPYCEYAEHLQSFQPLGRASTTTQNLTTRTTLVSSFLCPSGQWAQSHADGVAMTNYVGCHHGVEAPIDANNNGVFYPQQRDALRGHPRRLVATRSSWARSSNDGHGAGLGLGHARQPAEHRHADQPAVQSRPRRPFVAGATHRAGRGRGPSGRPTTASARRAYVGGFASRHPGGATSCSATARSASSRTRSVPRSSSYLGNRADGEILDDVRVSDVEEERYSDERGDAGFTLIELLIGRHDHRRPDRLLLPAVQSARRRRGAPSARTTCSSSASPWATMPRRTRPPARRGQRQGPDQNVPAGYHVGWAVQILPFLEQGNLYRQFDFRRGVYDGANSTASGVRIGPSSARPTRGGSMNYMGCHHDVEAPIDADNHGVLYLNSHVGVRRHHRRAGLHVPARRGPEWPSWAGPRAPAPRCAIPARRSMRRSHGRRPAAGRFGHPTASPGRAWTRSRRWSRRRCPDQLRRRVRQPPPRSARTSCSATARSDSSTVDRPAGLSLPGPPGRRRAHRRRPVLRRGDSPMGADGAGLHAGRAADGRGDHRGPDHAAPPGGHVAHAEAAAAAPVHE